MSNPDSPLRCPFCKDVLQNLTHEPDCDPASVPFDLSCIEHANVLKPDELLVLQEHARSISRVFGLVESLPSELDELYEIKRKLSSFSKVWHRGSRLEDLPDLSADDAALFFPHNPDGDSDPEPEPESDDDDYDQADQDVQDDQADQADQADWDYEDDYGGDNESDNGDEAELNVQVQPIDPDDPDDPDDYQENQGYQNQPNYSQNSDNESDGYASD
jgi:hypothetical protein